VNHFFVEQFVAGRGQNPFSSFPPSPDGGIKRLNLISFIAAFFQIARAALCNLYTIVCCIFCHHLPLVIVLESSASPDPA
jgi:hypothetical protein